MPLQLDIEPVAEQPLQRGAASARELGLAGRNRRVKRAAWTAGERDQSLSLAFEPRKLQMGFSFAGVSRKAREHSRIRLR